MLAGQRRKDSQMMVDWVQIRQRVFDAFGNVTKPEFSSIPILGCCERHEQDFDWYRHHTWQEFETASESRGFDPADFAAIHPLAFHYFTPGVLCTAIKRLATDAEKHLDDDFWIHHFIIAPYRLDEFKKEYLPLYNNEQRKVVSEALKWYQQWFLAQNGYDYDELEEEEEEEEEEARGKISETIAFVWQSET
jgi:hypothetical protein